MFSKSIHFRLKFGKMSIQLCQPPFSIGNVYLNSSSSLHLSRNEECQPGKIF